MGYLIIVLSILILGLIASKACFADNHLSIKKIEWLQAKINHLLSLGKMDQARKFLNILLKSPHAKEETLLLNSRYYRKQQNWEKSLSPIHNYLSKHPKQLPLIKELATIYFEKKSWKEALFYFQQVKSLINSVEEVTPYATVLLKNSHTQKAWSLLQPYLSKSKYTPLLHLAGDCRFKEGLYAQALKFYQQSKNCHHTNYSLLINTGICLREIGQIEEATTHFTQVLTQDPSQWRTRLELGLCLEKQKKHLEALKIYQYSSVWNQGIPVIYKQAGICATHVKKNNFAILYLEEALKLGLKCSQSLAYLGFNLEYQHEWLKAENCYWKLIQDFPKHLSGYRSLAWMYGIGVSHAVSSEQALQYAKISLQMKPDIAAWEVLSACEARSGNFIKAHMIQESLSLQGKDLVTQKRRRKAMRALRKKIPLSQQDLCKHLLVA